MAQFFFIKAKKNLMLETDVYCSSLFSIISKKLFYLNKEILMSNKNIKNKKYYNK